MLDLIMDCIIGEVIERAKDKYSSVKDEAELRSLINGNYVVKSTTSRLKRHTLSEKKAHPNGEKMKKS